MDEFMYNREARKRYRILRTGRFVGLFLPFLVLCAIFTGGRDSLYALDRPNIVLIIADDQAYTDFGFMGHPHIETPSLDDLANRALLFTRGYVTAPLCRPSLASIITGLHPHQHGITGNDPELPAGISGMRSRTDPRFSDIYEQLIRNIEKHPTLANLLVSKGYLTLQTGKWWEGDPKRAGFTHAMTHGDPSEGGRHGDGGLTIGREGLDPIYSFIEEARSSKKPFFIWYAPFLPHAPHTPPQQLLKKYLKLASTEPVARYQAMCEFFDQTVGDLMSYLEQNDLSKETLIVFVSDNGWIQDPERVNRYAARSKRTPYEGGTRTPIFLFWPGQIQPKRIEDEVVSSIDLLPTFLSILDIPSPGGLSGINLLDPDARSARRAVFGASYAHDVADVYRPTRSLQTRWMVTENWKLIVPSSSMTEGKAELYNLSKDPSERKNLASDNPDMVYRMMSRLDAWWRPSPD